VVILTQWAHKIYRHAANLTRPDDEK
jgi:hypothetical protein